MKAGGMRPSQDDYRYLVVAVLIGATAVIAMGATAGAAAAGDSAGFLVTLIFGLWEFRRFRIRRAHPTPHRLKPPN